MIVRRYLVRKKISTYMYAQLMHCTLYELGESLISFEDYEYFHTFTIFILQGLLKNRSLVGLEETIKKWDQVEINCDRK